MEDDAAGLNIIDATVCDKSEDDLVRLRIWGAMQSDQVEPAFIARTDPIMPSQ